MSKFAIKYGTLSKQVIDEHNKIRQDPKCYIPHLEKELTYFTDKMTMYKPGCDVGICTNEGKDAYYEAIDFLKKQKPMTPFKTDELLSKAAQDHADDIGPKGITEHTGSDGSQMSDRVERYLEWNISCGENISFDNHTAVDIVVQLIVDDGNTTRGHRGNVFSTKFNYAGAGCADHTGYSICCVIDYVGEIVGKSGGSSSSKPQYYTTSSSNRGPQEYYTTSSSSNKAPQQYYTTSSSSGKGPNEYMYTTSSSGKGPQEYTYTMSSNENPNDVMAKLMNKMGNRNDFGGEPGVLKAKFIGFEDDLPKDFHGKVNINVQPPQKKTVSGFEDDPDAPANAIGCSIKVVTKTVNGKSTKKTIKKYKLDDGSEETVEIEETC
jgi:uncharacterized protein YkwD